MYEHFQEFQCGLGENCCRNRTNNTQTDEDLDGVYG